MRSSSSLGAEPAAARRASSASTRIASPTGMVGGQRLGQRRLVVPPAAVLDLEREEVVVAAAEQRRAQRGHERELVGRVVDGPQHHEQVADLAGAVDERRRLGPVRDAGGVERVLERPSDVRAGSRIADVAEPARLPRLGAVGVRAATTGQPSRERGADDRGDVGGLALAQLVGVRASSSGVGAEQHDGRADRRRARARARARRTRAATRARRR